MPVPYLDPDVIAFPEANDALTDPNGLLAAGGDLSKNWLIAAYRRGIFPWYEDGQPILWWSPDPRLSLVPEQFRISRSLRKLVKKKVYRVSFNQDFIGVINGCRTNVRKSRGTWITNEMVTAYTDLYHSGLAHSVEVWSSRKLVGGLYGVSLGKIFFGESMFSEVDNASKIALLYLTVHLREWGYKLIDCQVDSDHLESLGATKISRSQFLDILEKFITKDEKEGNWYVEDRLIQEKIQHHDR